MKTTKHTMAKTKEKNSEDLLKRLEEIIDRTRAQNRLLNKLLEDIGTKKPVSKKIKIKQ